MNNGYPRNANAVEPWPNGIIRLIIHYKKMFS